MDPNHFDDENKTDLNIGSHLFLSIHLFDRVVGSMGMVSRPERVLVPRTHGQHKLPGNLEKVTSLLSYTFIIVYSLSFLQLLIDLEDWTQPIRSFQLNLAKTALVENRGKRTIEQELDVLGIVLSKPSDQISSDTLLLQQQLVSLARGMKYSRSASVANVLANIELAGSGMLWLMNEQWGATEDTEGLAKVMEE
jgi:hypothetical protein